jgi:hypothetical protein
VLEGVWANQIRAYLPGMNQLLVCWQLAAQSERCTGQKVSVAVLVGFEDPFVPRDKRKVGAGHDDSRRATRHQGRRELSSVHDTMYGMVRMILRIVCGGVKEHDAATDNTILFVGMSSGK